MAKSLSTLEVGLVAAGTGQLLRCLVDRSLQRLVWDHPWLLEADGLLQLLAGAVGSVGLVALLTRRGALPLRAPLGVFLAGCAVALALDLGAYLDFAWDPGDLGPVVAWTLARAAAGLAAGLALALRPPLRPRAPRRSAGLALGLTLLAGGGTLRQLALDAWPEGYPEFAIELVPTRSLRDSGPSLSEGEEPWVSQGGELVPAEEGWEPTHALCRRRAVRLGPTQVLRLAWIDDEPAALSCRVTDQAAWRLATLSEGMQGERLLVFVDGRCVFQPEVRGSIGRRFQLNEPTLRRSPELRALYARVTGEAPPD